MVVVTPSFFFTNTITVFNLDYKQTTTCVFQTKHSDRFFSANVQVDFWQQLHFFASVEATGSYNKPLLSF